MASAALRFFCTLALTASISAAQAPRSFEIKLPPEVNSETVFIRYVLTGESFGGWVPPRTGVSSYLIDTTVAGHPASGIKALLYAPGCAFQTINTSLAVSNNEPYSFICHPLANIRISGKLTPTDRLNGTAITLQAKYIPQWAATSLGLRDTTVPVITIGEPAELSADGRFQISVPDLSSQANGEFRIQAIDRTTGKSVAVLIPAEPRAIATRMGGVKMLSEYPPEIVFTPCGLNASHLHDSEGFAHRSDARDACTR